MNAANTTSGKHPHARALRDPARRSDCGCSVPFLRDSDWQIANTDLLDLIALGNEVDFVRCEPDAKLAIEYGDGCGRRAGFANDLFQTPGGFEILRTRQAVSDDGGLKRDNRLVSRNC